MLPQPDVGLLAHYVHGKTHLMLAGAGDCHGFQRHFSGFVKIQVKFLHVFPGPLFQNVRLLLEGAVAAIENVLDSRVCAIGEHLHQRLVAPPIHPVPVNHDHGVGGIIVRNRMGGVDEDDLHALGGEIVGFSVNLRGTHGGGAVGQEVIAVFALLIPAGGGSAVFPEIIPLSADLLPGRRHGAVGLIVAHPILGGEPAGVHDAFLGKVIAVVADPCIPGQGLTGFVKAVNVAVHVCKAGSHFAVVAEIVPLSVDLLPARGENAVGEVTGNAVQLLPAGEHSAVFVKAVGAAADGLPAGQHDAVASKVPGNAVLFQPAGGGNAALQEKVPLPVYVQPAGDRLGVKIPVIPHAAFFCPAAAVDLGVVHEPRGAGRKGEQLKNQRHCQNAAGFCFHIASSAKSNPGERAPFRRNSPVYFSISSDRTKCNPLNRTFIIFQPHFGL